MQEIFRKTVESFDGLHFSEIKLCRTAAGQVGYNKGSAALESGDASAVFLRLGRIFNSFYT